MTTRKKSLVERLVKLGSVGALLVAGLIWIAYAAVSASATTFQVVAMLDPAAIEVNRFLYSEEPTGDDADILGIYGAPVGAPEALVFVDPSLVVHPEERPTLAWVQRVEDREPVPLGRVRFGVIVASLGAAAAALGFGLLGWIIRRRASA